jgi:hypothetical protein
MHSLNRTYASTSPACWCKRRRSVAPDIFWVLVAPKRHVLFEFTCSHDSDAADHVLAGYDRYLVADAYVVYDHLYSDGNVIESTVGHSVAHHAKNADQCSRTRDASRVNALRALRRLAARTRASDSRVRQELSQRHRGRERRERRDRKLLGRMSLKAPKSAVLSKC